jgi:hypothetical protein
MNISNRKGRKDRRVFFLNKRYSKDFKSTKFYAFATIANFAVNRF